MKPNPVATAAPVNPRAIRALVLTFAVLLLAGCGSAAGTGAADEGVTVNGQPHRPPRCRPPGAGHLVGGLSTATTAVGTTPAPAASTSSGDVTAAVQSALGLLREGPPKPPGRLGRIRVGPRQRYDRPPVIRGHRPP